MLGFLLAVWLSLAVILATAPEIYGRTLRMGSADHRTVAIVFVAAITAFIALLSVGIVRRWRWTFWLSSWLSSLVSSVYQRQLYS